MDARKSVERKKLNKVVNKMEKEDKFKNLFSDDDLNNDDNVDIGMYNDFLTLPIIKQGNLATVSIASNYDLLHYLYVNFVILAAGKLGQKNEKEETNACNDEENVDKKPIISENGEGNKRILSLILSDSYAFASFVVVNVKKEQNLKMDTASKDKKEPIHPITNIIENKANSYILMQVIILSLYLYILLFCNCCLIDKLYYSSQTACQVWNLIKRTQSRNDQTTLGQILAARTTIKRKPIAL